MARALAPTDLDLRLLPRPQSADLGGLGAYAVELEAPVFPVALPPGDAMAGRGQRSHALPRVEVVIDVDGAAPARALRALERLHDVAKPVEGPRPQIRIEVLVGRRRVALPVPPDRAPEGGDLRVRRPLAIEHGIAAVDVRQPEPLDECEGLLGHPR